MLTVDTSAILALADQAEPEHRAVKRTFLEDGGPYLLPAGILGEVAYMLQEWSGVETLDAFLQDLESHTFSIDCGEDAVARVRELVTRYADLRLGFADASVIACAERNGGRILTRDRRDFGVVAREGSITILP